MRTENRCDAIGRRAILLARAMAHKGWEISDLPFVDKGADGMKVRAAEQRDAALFGTELGGEIASYLAGARKIVWIEGDGGNAGMAAAAKLLGE